MTAEPIRAGSAAPALDLPDVEGRPAHPLEPRPGERGPALIAFYKHDCPTCRYAFPFLGRLHRALAGTGARIWGVAQDGAEATRAFAAEMKLDFPVLLDAPPYRASRAYGVTTVPALVLVGGDGVVRRSWAGWSRSEVEATAAEIAAALGAPAPSLFAPGEPVLDIKPG